MAIVWAFAHFRFYDGKKMYTVQYSPTTKRWTVYNRWGKNLIDYSIGNANPRVNQDIARNYLNKYLESEK